MKTKNHTIKANSSSGVIGSAGNFMAIEYMSGPFRLRLGNRANVLINERKTVQSPRNWDQYELINETAEDITVKLTVGETDTLIMTSSEMSGQMSIEQGVTLTNAAPVAVSDAGDLVAGTASRKGLHIRNTGGTVVYLGGAGVTSANAAVELQPGEEFREETAAAAAWYGITSAGQAGTVNVMGLV